MKVFSSVLALAVVVGHANAAFLSKVNASIPITEKVSVEGTEVYSQSAGHALLNTCSSFAPSFVEDESKPSITVCGTMTKVTVYLLNECDKYSKYQLDIGTCDTSAPSTTCVTQSPATTKWLMTAQSYEIKQCATGTQ
mmetsp:Transcript_37830/g.59895  ORF Transcript_37830/g.59895 Transcript_37830/m.59895 type:complete len:138 (+) Transcript_37830:60-473(+)